MLDQSLEFPQSQVSRSIFIAAFKYVVLLLRLRHFTALLVRPLPDNLRSHLHRNTRFSVKQFIPEGLKNLCCGPEQAQRVSGNSSDASVIFDQAGNTIAGSARTASQARTRARSKTILSASSDSTIPGNTDVPVGSSDLSSLTSTDILRAAHKVSDFVLPSSEDIPPTSFVSPSWALLHWLLSLISRHFTLDLTLFLNCCLAKFRQLAPGTLPDQPPTPTGCSLRSPAIQFGFCAGSMLFPSGPYRMPSAIGRHSILDFARARNSRLARPRLTATINRSLSTRFQRTPSQL